ncbi:sigma-70 family RNA polymerase sigma factor [Sphingobium sp. H39-3-25]|uniref:sigma-70 family RNA polymerase sigma factor n=1 Tax=Sphingobium arseniciresistens TaxID=3030834 RepID=UPI0023B8EB32|nr:sigma-70 family RNA polymerase sigma factor [Sphingobium arseniciresistens]
MDRVRAKLEWFKTCLLPHEAGLRARLRRILSNHHELDDMVAEIMTRAYACESWERITAGRSYLFAIARNLVIDNARRNKVVSFESIADLELLQAGPNVEAQIHARDALRQVQEIVDTLPPQCRRAFILRRIHEKSMAEIAEEMELSVSTVEKHLAKSVSLVMRSWAEREETDFERAEVFGRIKQAADRGRSRTASCPAQP